MKLAKPFPKRNSLSNILEQICRVNFNQFSILNFQYIYFLPFPIPPLSLNLYYVYKHIPCNSNNYEMHFRVNRNWIWRFGCVCSSEKLNLVSINFNLYSNEQKFIVIEKQLELFYNGMFSDFICRSCNRFFNKRSCCKLNDVTIYVL